MKRQYLIIFFHSLFWVLILFYNYQSGNVYAAFSEASLALPFYFNYFYLVPRFFKKNEPKYYLLWAVLFWVTSMGIYALYNIILGVMIVRYNCLTWKHVLGVGFHITFFYAGLSTGSRLLVDWLNNQTKTKELIMYKSSTQIKLMKSNINIPFMLQVLSYTEQIAKTSPQSIEEPIMRLSNLLRYALYESKADKVFLERELEILQEYINLNNQISQNMQLELHTQGLLANQYIVPNILIKCINAWKNSESQLEGKTALLLYNEDHTLVMRFPVNRDKDVFVKSFAKDFPQYNDDHFQVSYSCEGDTLFVRILSTIP